MSETRSIKEQITAAVAARLREITVANGYQVDVAEVVRPRRTGEHFAPVNLGISIIQGNATRANEYDLASNPPVIAWRLGVACDCVIMLSETSEVAMDTALNQFEADVQKCLMVDPTFGGLALLAELGEVTYPDWLTGGEGVTVWIYITYRVSEDDPYEQR